MKFEVERLRSGFLLRGDADDNRRAGEFHPSAQDVGAAIAEMVEAAVKRRDEWHESVKRAMEAGLDQAKETVA